MLFLLKKISGPFSVHGLLTAKKGVNPSWINATGVYG